MSDSEALTSAKILLVKLNVITGWPIPEDNGMQTILTDQFVKFMQETYPNMTAAEVEYAFRHMGDVKDYGKSMNLVLVDQVLGPYLQRRQDASEAEERKAKARTRIELNWKINDLAFRLLTIDKGPRQVFKTAPLTF